MASKRELRTAQSIVAEFEYLRLMGHYMVYPKYDPDLQILTFTVVSKSGRGEYEVEMTFPRHAPYLRPPLRLPVEEDPQFPPVDQTGVDKGTPFGEFDSFGYLND